MGKRLDSPPFFFFFFFFFFVCLFVELLITVQNLYLKNYEPDFYVRCILG